MIISSRWSFAAVYGSLARLADLRFNINATGMIPYEVYFGVGRRHRCGGHPRVSCLQGLGCGELLTCLFDVSWIDYWHQNIVFRMTSHAKADTFTLFCGRMNNCQCPTCLQSQLTSLESLWLESPSLHGSIPGEVCVTDSQFEFLLQLGLTNVAKSLLVGQTASREVSPFEESATVALVQNMRLWVTRDAFCERPFWISESR
jgi:hypothetical protein